MQSSEYPSIRNLLPYIGRVVDGVVLVPEARAQLSSGGHNFTVRLDDASRLGPEALHNIGVDAHTRTDLSFVWIR